MPEERVQRRLAAIMAADVVGYSRLMEQDETGTLARLQSLRAEIIDPKITEHGGRIVKTMGDGVLAEFPSAVAAVENALSIQHATAEHEADQPKEKRIMFRVGINLGDVIIEGDDIHGDGVNVAARLEGLCQPGEVYVSATVYDHVEGKLAAAFDDLGEQAVKNITRPVRVYRVRAGTDTDTAPKLETQPVSNKPSIVVLPFANMSGDPEQEYFADGITEDIITALSRWRTIPVIARNSSYVYKGQSVDIRKVGEELGVRYVLEGSVRKADNRIRITTQLIEVETNHHVWAEQYDRDLEDIFEVQDEIVQRIAAIIGPTIERTERQRSIVKPTDNLTAWDYCLRGYAQIYLFTKEATEQARDLFSRAIELDPQYARAHTGLCATYTRDLRFRWCADPDEWLRRLFDSARRAIALDELDSEARTMLVRAYHVDQNPEAATIEARRAVALNPYDAFACNVLGSCYLCLPGARYQEGIPWFEKALELNPLDPQKHNYLSQLAIARLCSGQNEAAIENAEEAVRDAPSFFEARVALASAYGYLGRTNDALNIVAGFNETAPSFVEQEPRWADETKNYVLDGLRKAGLADEPFKQEAILTLPDKPSIAVLAFENMSNDSEQEYFSDGISEDIITELSKISGLFVIARNSSFVYKGKPVSMKQIGQELGVQYVLEGSVRKAGNRLRITAQLIDSGTDNHLWAERYDRDLEDIFALQDEIAAKIVAALEVRLTAGEQERVATRYTKNLEAYDYFLRGRAYQRGDTKETNDLALKMAQRAIELDPSFAGAHALMSLAHYRGWRRGWNEDSKNSERAFEAAKKAVALDDSLALAHTCLAWANLYRKQYEEAIAEGRRAISLDPNFAESYARLGLILTLAGEPAEAPDLVKKAMRLDPLYPASYHIYLGTAYYSLGKYDEAIATCKKGLTRSSDIMGCNLLLAVIHSELGRNEEAQAEAAEVLRLSPRASIERLRERVPFKDQALMEQYLEGLRKAGLPE